MDVLVEGAFYNSASKELDMPFYSSYGSKRLNK